MFLTIVFTFIWYTRYWPIWGGGLDIHQFGGKEFCFPQIPPPGLFWLTEPTSMSDGSDICISDFVSFWYFVSWCHGRVSNILYLVIGLHKHPHMFGHIAKQETLNILLANAKYEGKHWQQQWYWFSNNKKLKTLIN